MITTTIDGITTNYVRTKEWYLPAYQEKAAYYATQIKDGLYELDHITSTAERKALSELLRMWSTEFDYAADAIVNLILYS